MHSFRIQVMLKTGNPAVITVEGNDSVEAYHRFINSRDGKGNIKWLDVTGTLIVIKEEAIDGYLVTKAVDVRDRHNVGD